MLTVGPPKLSVAESSLTISTRLAALSVVVAIDAVAAYVFLLRVAVVRNHPEGYVVAFAPAPARGWTVTRLEQSGPRPDVLWKPEKPTISAGPDR